MTKETPKRKINKKKFVLNSIHKLRKSGYMGIHVVYSGFNKAFRDYYNEDPITEVEKLVIAGVIIKSPVKGGVMLYDKIEYEEFVKKNPKKAKDDVLEKILG